MEHLLLLFVAILFSWHPGFRHLGALSLLGFLIVALHAGLIEPVGLMMVGLIGAVIYLARQRSLATWLRFLLLLPATAAGCLAMRHFLPGFHNPRLLEGISLSPISAPFTLYANIDSAMLGILILLIAGKDLILQNTVRDSFKVGLVALFSSLFVLLPLALAIGFLKFDPKLPQEAWLWMMVNLGIVCLTEEAFYRGFVLRELRSFTRSRWSQNLIFLAVNVLFAVMHYPAGPKMMLLSFVAGLFYAAAYVRTRSLEASVFCHFGVNATRFFLFAYPSL